MTILKEYRINNELGQKEMADKLKCSLPAYRNYENGKRCIPPEQIMYFFKLRSYPSDLKILEALEEIYGKI